MAAFKFGRSRKTSASLVQVGGTPAPTYNASSSASPRAADMTVGDYANGIPNIKLGEMVKSFFRQMVWVIPLGLIGLVVAWVLTADIKRTFSGEGTIMVQLGDEYVYQPIAGTQGQSSLLQTPDTITLNEVAIIKNPEVMDRVIGEIASRPGGLKQFAPDIAAKMARHREGTTDYQLAYMELRRMMDNDFYVAARPKSSIIDLSYKHEDPQLAVSTLNALMDAYMSYRRTVFVEGSSTLIAQRRADTESQLKQNERQMASFLRRNGISNFTSEQEGASERTEDLRASLNAARAEAVEAEKSLATVEDRLRQTPATIDLYVDDRLSNRVAQAELELQQLLAKYLPTSDPVRQKRLEIQELRNLESGGNGRTVGGRRVGPNPEYQALLLDRNRLQASANSLREKEFTLQQQLNEADSKVRRLTSLSPEYNDLVREHETLTTRLRNYLNQEQEALINQQQAEASSENVKVISGATYPIKGRNMRILAFLLAGLFWAFTLGMIALFRVFSDPRLYAVPAPIQDRVGSLDPVAHEPIPEPLQPYQPATPMPSAAPMPNEYEPEPYPAATEYGAMSVQSAADSYYPHEGGYQTAEYQADAYAPAAYQSDPYQPAAYEQPQVYDAYGQPVQPAADGTLPYVAEAAPVMTPPGDANLSPYPGDENNPYL